MKLVCGVGINEKTRPAKVNDKKTKEYALWYNMIQRCYYEKLHTRRATYVGCTVSENFKNYSYFYDWCQKQIGFYCIDGNGRNWNLDKDIVIRNNKNYSEDTCVFVPFEVNLFFVDNKIVRGENPIGIYFYKQTGKYKATCAVNGKAKHLGFFSTPEEAFSVYKQFKESLCKELANKWRCQIDNRVYDAMMAWSVEL